MENSLMSKKLPLLFFAIIALASCSHLTKDLEEQENLSAEALYAKAFKYLDKKEYEQAADFFGKVGYEYPYHELSISSQVLEIYSYYLAKDYDLLIPAIEHFIQMHPANKNIPYVSYINALAYYEQIDLPVRDQSITNQAKGYLTGVMRRFPHTSYAKDVKIKISLVNENLAASEMNIGRYYLNTGSILSAINRFKTVVEQYQTTSFVEEALYRLAEAYHFLGLDAESKRNAAVLGHNYPHSKWYRQSYNLLQ